MKKMFFCIAIILCLVLLVPVAGGCSETEEENTFVKLLSLLPETARDGRVISIIDYEQLRQVNGISIYDEDGHRTNRDEYLENLGEMAVKGSLFGDSMFQFGSYWTGCGPYVSRAPIQDEYIGYEVTDVFAEINNIFTVSSYVRAFYNIHPDINVAAIGEFRTQSTETALKNSDEWPDRLVNNYISEDYNNITIHSWGNSQEVSLIDSFSPPHLDQIGRAFPLAVSDGRLFISSSVEGIKSMIDANQNEAMSLADIPEYVQVVKSMHELGAIAVMIMDEAYIRDIFTSPESYMGPQIQNYLTVGMGLGKDEKGEYMALVLVYNDPVLAEEGATLLEQKVEAYNELCRIGLREDALIYDTEIRFENEVLLAKLYNDYKGLWNWWFFDQWWLISVGYA